MNQKKRAKRLTKSFQLETKSMKWRVKRLAKIVRDSKVPDIPVRQSMLIGGESCGGSSPASVASQGMSTENMTKMDGL